MHGFAFCFNPTFWKFGHFWQTWKICESELELKILFFFYSLAFKSARFLFASLPLNLLILAIFNFFAAKWCKRRHQNETGFINLTRCSNLNITHLFKLPISIYCTASVQWRLELRPYELHSTYYECYSIYKCFKIQWRITISPSVFGIGHLNQNLVCKSIKTKQIKSCIFYNP